MRVLKWIVDRVHGRAYAVESPFGWMPRHEDIALGRARLHDPKTFHELMSVSRRPATRGATHEEQFDRFYDRLPKEFLYERELLRSRLWRSPERWELAHE